MHLTSHNISEFYSSDEFAQILGAQKFSGDGDGLFRCQNNEKTTHVFFNKIESKHDVFIALDQFPLDEISNEKNLCSKPCYDDSHGYTNHSKSSKGHSHRCRDE